MIIICRNLIFLNYRNSWYLMKQLIWGITPTLFPTHAHFNVNFGPSVTPITRGSTQDWLEVRWLHWVNSFCCEGTDKICLWTYTTWISLTWLLPPIVNVNRCCNFCCVVAATNATVNIRKQKGFVIIINHNSPSIKATIAIAVTTNGN